MCHTRVLVRCTYTCVCCVCSRACACRTCTRMCRVRCVHACFAHVGVAYVCARVCVRYIWVCTAHAHVRGNLGRVRAWYICTSVCSEPLCVWNVHMSWSHAWAGVPHADRCLRHACTYVCYTSTRVCHARKWVRFLRMHVRRVYTRLCCTCACVCYTHVNHPLAVVLSVWRGLGARGPGKWGVGHPYMDI